MLTEYLAEPTAGLCHRQQAHSQQRPRVDFHSEGEISTLRGNRRGYQQYFHAELVDSERRRRLLGRDMSEALCLGRWLIKPRVSFAQWGATSWCCFRSQLPTRWGDSFAKHAATASAQRTARPDEGLRLEADGSWQRSLGATGSCAQFFFANLRASCRWLQSNRRATSASTSTGETGSPARHCGSASSPKVALWHP